ncbi:MAG: HPr(Ser) kinase/phosphatase [Clostridiales bacterium]|nr:HPr(Ser) kinase/phosphatase [Clostridiales bacterium]
MNSTLLNISQGYNNLHQKATVAVLAERMNLENLTPEIDLENRVIEEYSIARPSFQLTGFFDIFPYKRVQIIGKTEYQFMQTLSGEVLKERFEKIVSYQIPCIIVTWNLPVSEMILELCRSHGVPVLRTAKETMDADSEAIKLLRVMLSPKLTIHGVLVDVYGIGVLIRGDSGIGKSEAALELIKRGHRLVADDVVEIRKVSDETLVGVAPELTRDFIELRGIGVINIRAMFGYEAVKGSQNIDMIVNLEEYRKEKNYDRFGLEPRYDDIMGNKIFKVDIPVRPGRNIAVIVESAAINFRAKIMGYDAPEDFMSRIKRIKENAAIRDDGCGV